LGGGLTSSLSHYLRIPFKRRANVTANAISIPYDAGVNEANKEVKRSTMEFLTPNENAKPSTVRKYIWPYFYGKGTRLGFAFIVAVILLG
jgi:hypothetical protein